MADYTCVEKVKNPWDFIEIKKCTVPLTGNQQRYRIKVGSYRDEKIIHFVIDEDELRSFKRQLEDLA